MLRVGIDLGGTKIEGIALDSTGIVVARRRVPTPRGDYAATLEAVAALAEELEREGVRSDETRRGSPVPATVGVGMPGVISPATGLVKNFDGYEGYTVGRVNQTFVNVNGQPKLSRNESVTTTVIPQ